MLSLIREYLHLLSIVAMVCLVLTGCYRSSDLGFDTESGSCEESPEGSNCGDDAGIDTSFVCEGLERTIVIGDIHGDVDAAREALQIGGVIDENDCWIGGPTTVVQTGDILDRGPGEREIIELFLDLKQFTENYDCGAVHVLVGNHEALNASGIFNYVDEETCEEFCDLEDLDLSQPELEGLSENCKKRGASFLPGGPYAQIMATWPVSLIQGDAIYVHGGIIPALVENGVDAINEAVSRWLLGKEDDLSTIAYTMVWDRTYSSGDPTEKECEILAGLLDDLGLSHMVVGHTVQEVINPACDGMVWRVDIGMTAYYGGTTQVLQIQDGQFTVLENIK